MPYPDDKETFRRVVNQDLSQGIQGDTVNEGDQNLPADFLERLQDILGYNIKMGYATVKDFFNMLVDGVSGLASKVSKTGDTMSGTLNMGGNAVNSVPSMNGLGAVYFDKNTVKLNIYTASNYWQIYGIYANYLARIYCTYRKLEINFGETYSTNNINIGGNHITPTIGIHSATGDTLPGLKMHGGYQEKHKDIDCNGGNILNPAQVDGLDLSTIPNDGAGNTKCVDDRGDSMTGDLKFTNTNNGPTIIDRSTATEYRLKIDNGVLSVEAAV